MSLRQYAAMRKDRKLPGGSHAAVRKAIQTGRLVDAVRMNSKGAPLINPEVADREWNARTDPTQTRAPSPPTARKQTKQPSLFGGEVETQRPGDGAPGDEIVGRIRRAQASKLEFAAKLTELEYRHRARQLVDVAAVDREVTRIVGDVVTELREIPDRTCSHVAATNDAHRAKMLLSAAIDQVLEKLSTARLNLQEPAT